MKLIRLMTVLGLTAAVGIGCVPDPLEGFDNSDAAPSNNQNNVTTGDAGNNNTSTGDAMMMNGGSFTQEFIAVSEILNTNCVIAACHGNPPGAAQTFQVPVNEPTHAELQTALSTTTPAPSGMRLITPNQPTMSEVYVRITLPAGDPQLMGAGTYGAAATPLSMTQIQTIEDWISNGAQYTQ